MKSKILYKLREKNEKPEKQINHKNEFFLPIGQIYRSRKKQKPLNEEMYALKEFFLELYLLLKVYTPLYFHKLAEKIWKCFETCKRYKFSIKKIL